MLTVVYAIECRKNGYAYVGLSNDCKHRWRQHRWSLRAGRHNAAKMNRDWRKFGEAAFEMRVLEVLPLGVKVRQAAGIARRRTAESGCPGAGRKGSLASPPYRVERQSIAARSASGKAGGVDSGGFGAGGNR
jgi:hypothetical protein